MKPSMTALRKAASSCVFDPRANGPMAVIVDAMDERYWEQRALEQIREIHNTDMDSEQIENRLKNAIGLLLLSMVKRGQGTKARPKRSRNTGSNREQTEAS